LQPLIGKTQVNKARSSQLGRPQQSAGGEVVNNGLGKLAWVGLAGVGLACRGSRNQGDIGAIVAVVGLFGALNFNAWQVKEGQRAVLLCSLKCGVYQGTQGVSNHSHSI
jgi:hypothetical protein